MIRREAVTATEESQRAIRSLVDQISGAGARRDFDKVDELVGQIQGVADQDFLCLLLNRRLALAKRNQSRRHALAMALAHARPEAEEVQRKVFERAITIINRDRHVPTVAWTAVTLVRFRRHPEYGQQADEFLEEARLTIRWGSGDEVRDFVVSRRPEMRGLI